MQKLRRQNFVLILLFFPVYGKNAHLSYGKHIERNNLAHTAGKIDAQMYALFKQQDSYTKSMFVGVLYFFTLSRSLYYVIHSHKISLSDLPAFLAGGNTLLIL